MVINMSKLAIFFPGIGYTVDKPLMYYSRKLASSAGYEIRLLPYKDFPSKVQGDKARMVESFEIALAQTREMLADVNYMDYEEVLFVGKSIGTIVAAKLAQDYEMKNEMKNIRMVLYTPLEETLNYLAQMQSTEDFQKKVQVFTGLNDPWVGGKESKIPLRCHELKIPCISLENANHSLETGDAEMDLDYLKLVMKMTRQFIG